MNIYRTLSNKVNLNFILDLLNFGDWFENNDILLYEGDSYQENYEDAIISDNLNYDFYKYDSIDYM